MLSVWSSSKILLFGNELTYCHVHLEGLHKIEESNVIYSVKVICRVVIIMFIYALCIDGKVTSSFHVVHS